MKKKSQRFSLKKITPTHIRNDIRINEQIRNYVQKSKSQGKHKSYEKTFNNKFKVNKNSQIERQRIKTEADQPSNIAHLHLPKKDNSQKFKSKPSPTSRIPQRKNEPYSHQQAINKKSKKLYINSDISDVLKQKSPYFQKKQHPNTTKNNTKCNQSYRSTNKKTALEKYISESLQNLEYANRKKIVEEISNQADKTLSKNNKVKELAFQEVKQEILKEEKSPKSYRNRQTNSKHHSQRDESIERIELKFEKKKKNIYDLSKEQLEVFGDRFPDGFDKIKLLGRGGFSLVWLGQHKKSKKKYAIKQIITQSTHQTHVKQIWFGTYFFEFGGQPKQQFAGSQGIKNLVKLYYYFINKKDTWILYEKCGDSLGNALYQLKGQYTNSQKCYRIFYKPLYHRIRKNQNQLRRIVLEVAKALELLAENNIVHSDLKTQNILVRIKSEQQLKNGQISVAETKLIDYGSSFLFNNLRQFSMATPEYMAPEILNFILYENDMEYIPKLFEYVEKYNKPWVIDVWSLGCVLLEIVSGIPLWMSLKTIVRKKSTEQIKYGLFAIKGRVFDKIIRRQIQVVQNIEHYLSEQNYSGIFLEEDLKILLKKMLALNPEKRISPSEIVQFLQETIAKGL